MLKQYTAKFLRTLDPADLQPTLKALLDGVDPLDGNFNEMSLKAFLMGLLHPHRSEVDVINEPRLKDGSRRADLLLTHRDGRQVLIECKTLMPHQLSLPGFKDTRTTHFWSINDKEGVHKVLCGMARSDLLQVPLAAKIAGSTSIVDDVFTGARVQLESFGPLFNDDQTRDRAVRRLPKLQQPKLLVVSTVWNTHLAVEEVPFPVKSTTRKTGRKKTLV